MGTKHKKFTEEEETFLKENYLNFTNKELAVKLEANIGVIKNKLKKLGLVRVAKSLLSEKEINEKLKELAHPEISIDYSTYKGHYKKCRFIDSEYGEWWTPPINVLDKKCRHTRRGRIIGGIKNRMSASDFSTKLKLLKDNYLTLDESTYINGQTKCRFIDEKYGECYLFPFIVLSGGCVHPKRGSAKRYKSIEVVKQKIKEKWGDIISIKEKTYNGISSKAVFIHKEYGEWEDYPERILKSKRTEAHPIDIEKHRKSTFLSKYGFITPICNALVKSKACRSTSNTVIVKHWRDNREIECTGSFEYGVVKKLNELKIDFNWQMQFQLSNSIYFCDLYLKELNKYIEIKGYFYNDKSKNKWKEFHTKYPNSELWLKEEVISFTGKKIHSLRKDFNLYRNENII